MFNVITRLAALILLLVMPLQGIPPAMSVLQCPPVEAGAVHAANSDNGTGPGENGNAVKNFPEHFFCHQLVSGMPVAPAAAAPPDLPVFESSLSLLASLFFPEKPQPPPRSPTT